MAFNYEEVLKLKELGFSLVPPSPILCPEPGLYSRYAGESNGRYETICKSRGGTVCVCLPVQGG